MYSLDAQALYRDSSTPPSWTLLARIGPLLAAPGCPHRRHRHQSRSIRMTCPSYGSGRLGASQASLGQHEQTLDRVPGGTHHQQSIAALAARSVLPATYKALGHRSPSVKVSLLASTNGGQCLRRRAAWVAPH